MNVNLKKLLKYIETNPLQGLEESSFFFNNALLQ
jgi:hypothetical protein